MYIHDHVCTCNNTVKCAYTCTCNDVHGQICLAYSYVHVHVHVCAHLITHNVGALSSHTAGQTGHRCQETSAMSGHTLPDEKMGCGHTMYMCLCMYI